MRDRDLYATILGLTAPWKVIDVELDPKLELVAVTVEATGRSVFVCPECGESCPGYDTRDRRWRHLDTCQYQTILVAKVPRIKCPEHGVRQVEVPWGEAFITGNDCEDGAVLRDAPSVLAVTRRWCTNQSAGRIVAVNE